MADQISREEFIARFKAEPRLRDVYMLWKDDGVGLYGKYIYLGYIRFSSIYIFAVYVGCSWSERLNYTVTSYHAVVVHIAADILKNDVPYVESRHEVAYKKYLPNLAAEQPWYVVKNAMPSALYDLLHNGDINRQELQGVVHLEKMATERKLRLALGDSPLPIPIRQAIIEG